MPDSLPPATPWRQPGKPVPCQRCGKPTGPTGAEDCAYCAKQREFHGR